MRDKIQLISKLQNEFIDQVNSKFENHQKLITQLNYSIDNKKKIDSLFIHCIKFVDKPTRKLKKTH